MGNEKQHTVFHWVPVIFQPRANLPTNSRIIAGVGGHPISSLKNGSNFNWAEVQKIRSGGILNQNHLPDFRVRSGQAVASVPYFFTSEAFYFVNDQVIHVEGGKLSVL